MQGSFSLSPVLQSGHPAPFFSPPAPPCRENKALLERRHLLSTGLSTACYPWISTKHGSALPFATSLINSRISALPATQKNKVDLFLFFQLWLIIKCEPCTKLSSVLGLCCHETSDSKYREMGAHQRCCRGIFYTARVSMGQGTALFKDSGLLWQVAAGTSFSMWHREFKMIYKSGTTACLGHF